MPSCTGFLEPKKIETWTVEIYVQCWKFHVQFVFVYLNWFRFNSLLKCVSQHEIAKKFIHPLFWHSRLSKVIDFGENRKPVYDFLLVINSNLGPISHRFWDMATYWLKNRKFSLPPLINAHARGDPFDFMVKLYGS